MLTQLDQTIKALGTYNRLKDYEQDSFKQADTLIANLKEQFDQFRSDKDAFYKQIQRIYHRYQPYRPDNAYLYTEQEMNQALAGQRQVLETLRYYLNENNLSNWPVEFIQQIGLTSNVNKQCA
ncbi:hypothetical protein [Spirosoma validum]|uniref:hypothetical protein n=1 Tax=Spirosoma validum TaxID=2771355 RepID=UPI0037427A44